MRNPSISLSSATSLSVSSSTIPSPQMQPCPFSLSCHLSSSFCPLPLLLFPWYLHPFLCTVVFPLPTNVQQSPSSFKIFFLYPISPSFFRRLFCRAATVYNFSPSIYPFIFNPLQPGLHLIISLIHLLQAQIPVSVHHTLPLSSIGTVDLSLLFGFS